MSLSNAFINHTQWYIVRSLAYFCPSLLFSLERSWSHCLSNFSSLCFSVFLIFFKFYFIFKLYIIVLVLPNIKMNPPQVYMCSPSWTLLPPHSIPLGRPSAESKCLSDFRSLVCVHLFVHGSYSYVSVFT